VTFRELHQDSQEYGSDDEHMVSRVRVDIAVDRNDRGSFTVNLKQTVGSDFETGLIEVTRPADAKTGKPYAGPFDQERFADEARKYFRGLVGSQGRGIKIGPGSKSIRMRDNRYVSQKVVEFSVTGRGEA